ncbi:flagellar biosynthesis protein FlhF [Bacillus suaedaesalsae]|uniref:Flagellar biosynthesis protein FlhF n=1 Tax=Bacillus suaedaesalsae TaxID=2810349 RepID=A0ABS2DIV5_9BACI|nr:flagellar biosynthesis protein FlhF [Bacillus suaedaesalsae]MBM6618427.1 flagellar biosynthesis protein FlhF [Bacillus suaedaesalsae]
MKVKKYVAPSMPEVMKKVRADLGKDAVILNSKVVHTGGFFGFFTKKNIEVMAAVDPSPFDKEPIQKDRERTVPVNIQPKREPSLLEDITPLVKSLNQKNDMDLLKEISELKLLIKDTQSKPTVRTSIYPEPLQKILLELEDQEINEEQQSDIMSKLLEKWYKNNASSSNTEIKKWVREELLTRVEQYEHGGISFKKKYINVVGPTGVGKTTTLAKIAAQCVIKHKKKVAFITTDTYRIAAIEQLKTYAKILDVPIEVCYNLDDFKKAKEKYSSYDLVFIDTAGRNFRNKQYVEDLKEVIDFTEEMETFLVLSLTAKQRDMEEIYRQFSLIFINRLIFTKTDETSQFGSILNLMTTYKKGVAYLTTGQNVPDDIMEATPTEIVNTILEVDTK